jgi:hypothetical protein
LPSDQGFGSLGISVISVEIFPKMLKKVTIVRIVKPGADPWRMDEGAKLATQRHKVQQ